MKNALLTSLALVGFAVFAPRAQAGTTFPVLSGYDRCGHPVYMWVHRSSKSHSSNRDKYYVPERTDYYPDYHRPTYLRDSCHSSVRGFYSPPRFSFHFGF